MSEAALDAFYQAEYRRQVQGQEGPSEKDLRVQAGRARYLTTLLQQYLDRVTDHLDIGSSAGSLLMAVNAAYGCASAGVEPGDAYRKFSQGRGLDIVAEISQLNRNKFDLITMVHVLEHLPDPVRYLQEIRQNWLSEHGFLLVEVPHLYGHTCYELSHLTAYAGSTLEYLLKKSGFEVHTLVRHGQPRSRIIPLYLTILAQARNESTMIPAKKPGSGGVRIRRWIAMRWHRWAMRLLPGMAWLPWPAMDSFDSHS
jgi:SAM-dependent methyltransferase